VDPSVGYARRKLPPARSAVSRFRDLPLPAGIHGCRVRRIDRHGKHADRVNPSDAFRPGDASVRALEHAVARAPGVERGRRRRINREKARSPRRIHQLPSRGGVRASKQPGGGGGVDDRSVGRIDGHVRERPRGKAHVGRLPAGSAVAALENSVVTSGVHHAGAAYGQIQDTRRRRRAGHPWIRTAVRARVDERERVTGDRGVDFRRICGINHQRGEPDSCQVPRPGYLEHECPRRAPVGALHDASDRCSKSHGGIGVEPREDDAWTRRIDGQLSDGAPERYVNAGRKEGRDRCPSRSAIHALQPVRVEHVGVRGADRKRMGANDRRRRPRCGAIRALVDATTGAREESGWILRVDDDDLNVPAVGPVARPTVDTSRDTPREQGEHGESEDQGAGHRNLQHTGNRASVRDPRPDAELIEQVHQPPNQRTAATEFLVAENGLAPGAGCCPWSDTASR
jgi:hypothetical protein